MLFHLYSPPIKSVSWEWQNNNQPAGLPFKLIIKYGVALCRVCSTSLLVDSMYVHSTPDTGTQEAGLGGLAMEGNMCRSHEPLPQRQVYRGTRLTVQPAVHLKKLSTGWGMGPAWGKRMENWEQENQNRKALHNRPEGEPDLVSWASGPSRTTGSCGRCLWWPPGGGMQKRREGGRAFRLSGSQDSDEGKILN